MIGALQGAAKINFDPAIYAMSWDGNSISDPGISDLVTQFQALAPVSSKIVITNKAINGQSIQQMTANHSDIDASWVNGKINILHTFELTNNIYNDGRTGMQTIADYVAFIQAVRAVHPWVIVGQTGIPRGSLFGSTWDVVTGEQQMEIANAYIRANYAAMGMFAYVESRRTGGPFDFTDCADAANFPAALWADRTHPSNGAGGGKSILAGYTADKYKTFSKAAILRWLAANP